MRYVTFVCFVLSLSNQGYISYLGHTSVHTGHVPSACKKPHETSSRCIG